MMSDFDMRGLDILKTILPDCSFVKYDGTLLVERGTTLLECKADFQNLFKLIDDDAQIRHRDSAEFYWKSFADMIEQALDIL